MFKANSESKAWCVHHVVSHWYMTLGTTNKSKAKTHFDKHLSLLIARFYSVPFPLALIHDA